MRARAYGRKVARRRSQPRRRTKRALSTARKLARRRSQQTRDVAHKRYFLNGRQIVFVELGLEDDAEP